MRISGASASSSSSFWPKKMVRLKRSHKGHMGRKGKFSGNYQLLWHSKLIRKRLDFQHDFRSECGKMERKTIVLVLCQLLSPHPTYTNININLLQLYFFYHLPSKDYIILHGHAYNLRESHRFFPRIQIRTLIRVMFSAPR